jgi:hypothetical protein
LTGRSGLTSTRHGKHYSVCRDTVVKRAETRRNKKGAAESAAPSSLSFAGDQVCWIAESSQLLPRGRTKVHT